MQLKRNQAPHTARREEPAAVAWPRILVAGSTFLLVVIGIVMVFSASSIVNIDAGAAPYADALKQLGFAAAGVAACVVCARVVPYDFWRGKVAWAVFWACIGLLVLTALIGTESLGAQRWISLGPVSLQPSEFAKIGVLLLVMTLVSDLEDGRCTAREFLFRFLGTFVLVSGLVLVAQSDLGTTLICFVGILAILWLAEVPGRFIAMFAGAVGALGIVALSQGYRLQRLMSFTDPWADYYGTGYQIIHSMYAFAQGGVFGAGLGNSAEKYLYLPESSTDFIFSIIGEELGLVGTVLVIGLFIAFLVGGLLMAREAPDRFGAVLCGSFAVVIVFQAFLNIGCVIGLMPITGKPLPFISAGGSSLIASLIMVGMMLSVSYAPAESPVYRQRRDRIRALTPDEMRAARTGGTTSRGPYGPGGRGTRGWEGSARRPAGGFSAAVPERAARPHGARSASDWASVPGNRSAGRSRTAFPAPPAARRDYRLSGLSGERRR